MTRKSVRNLLRNWRNRMLRICILIVLYFASVIGKVSASSCRNAIVAEVPTLSTSTSTFGEIHVLSLQQSTSVGQRSCLWEFSAPKGFLLNLHFINFTSGTCSYHDNGCFATIKKIFKGDSKVEVTRQYCGKSKSPGIHINGTVEIELQCNRTFSSYLVMAVLIEAASEHCGGIFRDSYHAATLSYDASQYQPNQIVHCVWYFDFSEEIQLSILVSQFSLRHDYSQRCGSEYLEIASRDDNGQIKILSRKCKAGNYHLPVNFTASGSRHFSVRIHSSKSGKTDEKVSSLCFPTTLGYFDAYMEISDIVQKPIKISSHLVPARSIIHGLLFLKTKSENTLFTILESFAAFCGQGAMHIWSDFVTEHGSNSTVCQKAPSVSRQIFNTQSSVIIYYIVAASKFREFNVTFFASNKGCGGAHQLTEGQVKTIKSQGYDQSRNYSANSDCRWLFLGNRYEFEVSILMMDLELCSIAYECSCDYIKIEPFKSKTPSYRLCGVHVKDYLVRGDMALFFHSDAYIEKEGFVVNVTAWEVCGREFYLLPGNTVEVVSPRYGKGAYPPDSLCQWNILTSDATVLNISVVDMNLKNPFLCDYGFYDYVEIFKGVYQNITLLKVLCDKPSANIVLNGSSTIRFRSDSSDSGRGFKMIIRAVPAIISTTTESPTTTIKNSTRSMPLSSSKRNVTTRVSVSDPSTKSNPVKSSSKCCIMTTPTVRTKVGYTTTLVSSKPTSSSKDKSVNQMVDKAPSSNDKLYIIGIVIPSTLILCAFITTIFYLHRRRVNHDSSEEKIEKYGHGETDRWKKRQSSTVPLVDIEGLQKLSSQNTSLPYIIENGCYGGTNLCESSFENENPYYSSDNVGSMNNPYAVHNDDAINPYYDSRMADYTSINAKEEQLYSEIHSKYEETEYAYAANLGYQTDSADGEIEDNPYVSIPEGLLK